MPFALAPTADFNASDHYISACLALAHEKLGHFASMAEIAARERQTQPLPPPGTAWRRPAGCWSWKTAPPRTGWRRPRPRSSAGEVLFEHAAAGEGTRLMLGPKYFLNIAREFTVERLAHLLSQESGEVR